MAPFSKEPSIPGKVVRATSRAGVGGGAILIGLVLFFLFRGFGPGGTGSSGSGTGSEENPGDQSMITKSEQSANNSKPSLAAPDKVRGGLTDDEKKALSGDILTVLIDEHEYLLQLPGTPDPIFRPTPLSRIVELATIATGDANGIKVRILRRESARASSEQQLITDLAHKGIRQDAVVMPSDFVP